MKEGGFLDSISRHVVRYLESLGMMQDFMVGGIKSLAPKVSFGHRLVAKRWVRQLSGQPRSQGALGLPGLNK